MGGFQSAFAKFKAAEGTFLVDYAHNDYLQTFAELGLAGFLIAALLAGSVILRTVRRVGEIGEVRWVGLACLGSLTAIAIHSTVDFNLYVAANAATLAWISGIAAGLAPSAPRIVRRRRNESERTV
jgi:O-antigen ligase